MCKKPLIVNNISGTIGTINPIRYRSYYYDSETGYYYLNSRYYDSNVGRFINADSINLLDIQDNIYDKNLHNYCDNNPVNRIDTDGEVWELVLSYDGALIATGGYSIGKLITLVTAGLSIISPTGWIIIGATTTVAVVVYSKSKTKAKSDSKKSKSSKKKSKESGKAKTNDTPSWSKHENYDKTRSVDENVEIIMNRKYGAGNWKKGPGSEASKVKKWLQRSRKLE